jgi:hypothetical protein
MAAKTTAKAPVRKPKKAISAPKARRTAGNRLDKIDRAILSMTASIAASEAKIAESDAKIAASIEAIKQSQEETNRAIQKSMDKLSGNVGDLNNRLGEIVELVVLPGLMEKMNTLYGHKFDNVSPRKKFTADGQQYAEIDLFLENGEEVMAVEAKTRFTLGMAHDFVNRVKLLRKHEIKAGLADKTIYAAIAGIGFDTNAKVFASEKGLYLVEIDYDNNKVKIAPPKDAVGKW